MAKYNINWVDACPDSISALADDIVTYEIDYLIETGMDEENKYDLFFHTIFLGESEDYMNEPIIMVYGNPKTQAFDCFYISKPEWTNMKEKS